MADTLHDIKRPVAQELLTFEARFRESVKSKVALLDKIMYYIIKRKGKRVRPTFVFLSAKACGEINDATYIGASVIELLHTATLVHDDVVDDAHMRRGFFSVNALWKNKIAVLVGDYLLSRGLLLSLDHEQYKTLQILSRAVKEMSEGELLQMEKARRLDITEEVYFDIIRQKTASLMAASCAVGASSTTTDDVLVQKMHSVGLNMGMAYQIRDDLLDYGNGEIGKPHAIDIQEKKLTLPLIYTLQNISPGEKRRIMKTVKNHSSDKRRVKEIIEQVHKSGGIAYAEVAMRKYRDAALGILDDVPQNEASTSLRKLVHFVIDRKK